MNDLVQLNNQLPDVRQRNQTLLDDPVELYLRGLDSESSRTEMARQLERVARLVGAPSRDALPWEQLRQPHYAEIRGRLLEYRKDPDDPSSGLAPSTINLAIASLRGVARACWELGYMTAEEHARVMSSLRSARGSRLLRGRAAAPGELTALMNVCARDPSRAGVRDAAIIAVMYSCELRRSEVASLTRDSYEPSRGELELRGKGNKERMVYPFGGAAAALEDWLVVRGDREGPLFLSIRRGDHLASSGLTDSAIYKLLRKRNAEAGISERLTPHDLRRSFATELFRAKVPGPTVQRMMGHSNLSTTARYDMSGAEAEREASRELYVPYTRRFQR